jgi:hypothetical protein
MAGFDNLNELQKAACGGNRLVRVGQIYTQEGLAWLEIQNISILQTEKESSRNSEESIFPL